MTSPSLSSYHRIPCTLLVVVLLFVFTSSGSAQEFSNGTSNGTEFTFTPSIRNFTQGPGAGVVCQPNASYTTNGPEEMCLTPQGPIVEEVAGRCLYSEAVKFSLSSNNSSNLSRAGLSFSTMFSFNTLRSPYVTPGEGFVFYLSPNNYSEGSAGGYLGWLDPQISTINTNATSGVGNQFAVEFDAYKNTDINFNDPDDNHIGINVNSMISVYTANPYSLYGINLTSTDWGAKLYAWIDYDGSVIKVKMSKQPNKPCDYLIFSPLDLQGILLDTMYAGFSSSVGDHSSAQTTVYDWSFNTLGHEASNIFGSDVSCHKKSGFDMIWKNIAIIIAVFLAIAVIILIVVLLYTHTKNRKNVRVMEKTISELQELEYGPREFTYKKLSQATRKFSDKEILGGGGFGVVYRGRLPSSRGKEDLVVAVKKISKTSVQGVKEFVAEVKVVGTLRHVNLVRVVGWCYERGEMLLVYDYMPNGNLQDLLFPKDEARAPVLSWEMRLRTLRGVAAALVFLHEECEERVVHRDVKSSNVMLDKDFNARLGDFGLSRLYDRKGAHPETVVAGTIGYLAPECVVTGNASPKSDVYSFGAMALEVATCRKPADRRIPRGQGLVKWVWYLHDEGKLMEAVDGRLGEMYKRDEMEKLLTIGLFCCLPDPDSRPTMRQVLTVLQGESHILSSKLPPLPVSGLSISLLDDDVTSTNFTTSELSTTSLMPMPLLPTSRPAKGKSYF